jgi:predicted NUDIX family NTP pyrophosphohydrolase
MAKKSAGVLVFHRKKSVTEVLLVHPGGPFWAKKDEGAWSIPKGEIDGDEEPLEVAKREYREETGASIDGHFIPLEPMRQPGGKIVYAWAVEGEFNASSLVSNTFMLAWPPKSGRIQEYPEVDRAEWFTFEAAMKKILKGQQGFIVQLVKILEKHEGIKM